MNDTPNYKIEAVKLGFQFTDEPYTSIYFQSTGSGIVKCG